MLAVPAARYGEFSRAARLACAHGARPRTRTWVEAIVDAPAIDGGARHGAWCGRTTRRQRSGAARRGASRSTSCIALAQQWGGGSTRRTPGKAARPAAVGLGRQGAAVPRRQGRHLAHLIKVDLQSELVQFTIDEQRLQHLERLDGKLLLVTNIRRAGGRGGQRYKSLADIERGFRALKCDIEIGPVYHRLPERIRAHALVCFLALILHRVLRMQLKDAKSEYSPERALQIARRIQFHQCAFH